MMYSATPFATQFIASKGYQVLLTCFIKLVVATTKRQGSNVREPKPSLLRQRFSRRPVRNTEGDVFAGGGLLCQVNFATRVRSEYIVLPKKSFGAGDTDIL